MKINKIEITFNTKWILENQIAGKSTAVSTFVDSLKSNLNDSHIFVINKSFHQCTIIAVADLTVENTFVENLLKSDLNIEDTSLFKLSISQISNDDFKNLVSNCREKFSDDAKKFLNDQFGIQVETQKTDVIEEAVSDVKDLISFEPLHKWVDCVNGIQDKHKKFVVESKMFQNTSYLFSINKGNGLSTALRIMASTLKKSGLYDFKSKRTYFEWKLLYQDDPERFTSLSSFVEKYHELEKSKFNGIICFDIEEWIDHLYDSRLESLFDIVSDLLGNNLFVFTVPYIENDVLDKVYSRLNDVLSIKTMRFVPPSDEQYFKYFCDRFAKFDIDVDIEVLAPFVSKIIFEKNDGRFYGFNTIQKIVDEILYNIVFDSVKNKTDITTKITKELFLEYYGMSDFNSVSGMEQLNGMIALEEVRTRIQEILATVKLQKELFNSGKSVSKPCFHMMFTGNPGTGKTVVARIVGRIFKEEGLLSVGNFFEVSRKDFVGKFVGHTAPKTMEICRNAQGSVLFIDEAYMLADENDSFSAEAIGTLIAEMENNRDRMIVIFAGYEKELEKLFEMNQGLRDRIPYKIHFPNYNRDELKQIFYLQFKNKIDFDESFIERVEEYFSNFPEQIMNMRDFSNGRFVRNLAERIISKSAMRFEMMNMNVADFKLIASDFDVAVADSDISGLCKKVNKTNRIGF